MLTFRDLISIREGLRRARDARGVKFQYARLKNLRIIDAALLQVKLEPVPGATEYEQKRVALCKQYSVKTTDGEPEIKDGQYVIDAGAQEEFDAAIQKLEAEYEDQLEASKRYLDTVLSGETSAALHKIKVADLPDSVDPDTMELIFPILED